MRRREFISTLTDEEAAILLYDWSFWARSEQLPPVGDWFVWLLRSGRGFGKTRTGAEWVRQRAEIDPHIALIGQTKADCRDTMIEVGESAILKISPPWFKPEYQPSKRRLVWPNGCIATVYSGDEPDQLRGPQHASAWVDELAKFKYPQQTWDNLLFGLRIGEKPQICVTTTPRPIPLIKALINDSHAVDIKRSTYDNIDNLSPQYFDRVIKPLEGTRLGRQEINADILDDVLGALWKRSWLESNRVVTMPDMARIVVAVDPPATSDSEQSAEAGIVVVGAGVDGFGYLLEDCSLRGTPEEWGRASVAAYHRHRADRIIGEVNNGGEMVEFVLRTVSPSVPFSAVYASRGKVTRAEPISALYEQGRIRHVGFFADLEDQLCNWIPGDKSPDRLDALVWGFTELDLAGVEAYGAAVIAADRYIDGGSY